MGDIMEILSKMITILAWVGVAYSMLVIFATYVSEKEYDKNKLKQALNAYEGIKVTFMYKKHMLLLVICSTYLVAKYF